MDKHSSPANCDERRHYFRIQADVKLNYLMVDQHSALANKVPTQFSQDQSYTLMQVLRDIDHDSNKYLRLIAEHNRDLEAYLKLTNKKIDVLAAALSSTFNPNSEQHNRHVSLSEGGLCFTTASPLDHGGHVCLQLTLLPSYVTLVLFGEIINCSKTDNGFTIVISFVNLRDGDRQQIAKHIMQLQLAEKRSKHSKED